jgi:hypothetical protein
MNFDDGQRYWDDKPNPTGEQISAVSETWLEVQRHWWGNSALDQLEFRKNKDLTWRLLLDICSRVDADDLDLAGDIGCGPLENFSVAYEDDAMDLVDTELPNNPTLLTTLRFTWTQGKEIPRIAAALERHETTAL